MSDSLSDVVVLILIILITFHVVTVDEGFDALLEVGRLGLAGKQ